MPLAVKAQNLNHRTTREVPTVGIYWRFSQAEKLGQWFKGGRISTREISLEEASPALGPESHIHVPGQEGKQGLSPREKGFPGAGASPVEWSQ